MRLDLRCFSLLAALAAGCTTLPLDQGGNQNGEDMKGSDPCQAAAGYCDPGDLVQPTCKTGYHEGTSVEQAHPGVCGLGICCVPDCAGYPDAQSCQAAGCGWAECPPNAECVYTVPCHDLDCRTAGCPDPNSTCEPCWAGYACLPPGAVC